MAAGATVIQGVASVEVCAAATRATMQLKREAATHMEKAQRGKTHQVENLDGGRVYIYSSRKKYSSFLAGVNEVSVHPSLKRICWDYCLPVGGRYYRLTVPKGTYR
jgi:hypothetical protein